MKENEKIQQKQKHTKGIKTGFIWDELEQRYGMEDTEEIGVVV